jgi:branched-subunit amino acid transport protein AzlD
VFVVKLKGMFYSISFNRVLACFIVCVIQKTTCRAACPAIVLKTKLVAKKPWRNKLLQRLLPTGELSLLAIYSLISKTDNTNLTSRLGKENSPKLCV